MSVAVIILLFVSEIHFGEGNGQVKKKIITIVASLPSSGRKILSEILSLCSTTA